MNNKTRADSDLCAVCSSDQLQEIEGFASLARITSDCRPFPAGGCLYACSSCSAVQKRPSPQWLSEIGEIYSAYSSYYQSGGDEQIVFDRLSGRPRRRSDVFLERLVASGDWPDKGTALDVGCGNGVTLSSMSRALSDWQLNGFEMSNSGLQRLQAIPGFRRLFSGSLETIHGAFDLVTMVHSLEHFPSPAMALTELRPAVGEGRLFIEVCNIDENPFDILIADHLMHFSPDTLSRLLRRCGFDPVTVATDWVHKEISLVARPNVLSVQIDEIVPSTKTDADKVRCRILKYVAWLNEMMDTIENYASGEKAFGVFGTSIAATWIASQLGERIAFFVDEDESRVGKTHLGRSILHPRDVPSDSMVYLALAPTVASLIGKRLGTGNFSLIQPPVMSDD
jgi:SAM-dependent methyltransferase